MPSVYIPDNLAFKYWQVSGKDDFKEFVKKTVEEKLEELNEDV